MHREIQCIFVDRTPFDLLTTASRAIFTSSENHRFDHSSPSTNSSPMPWRPAFRPLHQIITRPRQSTEALCKLQGFAYRPCIDPVPITNLPSLSPTFQSISLFAVLPRCQRRVLVPPCIQSARNPPTTNITAQPMGTTVPALFTTYYQPLAQS